jgi:hypothetical protein
MNIPLSQVGQEIVDKADEIYEDYFETEVTDEIRTTREYLAVVKGIMSGMLVDEDTEDKFVFQKPRKIKL